MLSKETSIKYIGGPTALFEAGGLRFLTDPTFDKKNSDYTTAIYTLHKLTDPAIELDSLGKIDFVLLSHDHHFDNLDKSGRILLSLVTTVYTTIAGAQRLGGNAMGLANWESAEVPMKDGRTLVITGTPCRHGPVNGDRGPVTGFVLQVKNDAAGAIYITGDTVWYEGVQEVARRFDIGLVIPFLGAATVKEVGPDHLTMTTEEAVKVARLFNKAIISPLHYEGWGHFTEPWSTIEKVFEEEGLSERLKQIT